MKINKASIVEEIYSKPAYNPKLQNGLKFTEDQVKAFGLELKKDVAIKAKPQPKEQVNVETKSEVQD